MSRIRDMGVPDFLWLLDFLMGTVAVAIDQFIFERFVLFILNLQGMALVVYQLDHQFAEGSILR
jgi:hypothetical protein